MSSELRNDQSNDYYHIIKELNLYLFVEGNVINNVFNIGTGWLRDNITESCSECGRPIAFAKKIQRF